MLNLFLLAPFTSKESSIKYWMRGKALKQANSSVFYSKNNNKLRDFDAVYMIFNDVLVRL